MRLREITEKLQIPSLQTQGLALEDHHEINEMIIFKASEPICPTSPLVYKDLLPMVIRPQEKAEHTDFKIN